MVSDGHHIYGNEFHTYSSSLQKHACYLHEERNVEEEAFAGSGTCLYCVYFDVCMHIHCWLWFVCSYPFVLQTIMVDLGTSVGRMIVQTVTVYQKTSFNLVRWSFAAGRYCSEDF